MSPSDESVRAWAYDLNAEPPWDHWDFHLSRGVRESLLAELAADVYCARRYECLDALYEIVGRHLSPAGRTWNDEYYVRNLLRDIRSMKLRSPEVRLWLHRSERLLAQEGEFDLGMWRGGGYAFGSSEQTESE